MSNPNVVETAAQTAPKATIKKVSRACVIAFAVVFVLGIAAFAGLNYIADPYAFFAMERGDVVTNPHVENYKLMNAYTLANEPSNTYTGIIIAGSKGAVISPAVLEHYTGYHYYQSNITYGNFDYYEQQIVYALQHQQIKHVVLHLSGLEVYVEEPSEESRHTPVVISGEPLWKDYFHYAFLGMNTAVDRLFDTKFDASKMTQKTELVNPTVREELDRIVKDAGRRAYHTRTDGTQESYEKYAKQYVLDYYGDYNWAVGQLFSWYEPDLINKDACIATLQRIKNTCDAYGAELTVILGSTFLTELYRYECPDYYDYIYQIAQICDLWDFSYFCDYNLNPYNFFNANHNLESIAVQMIMKMYGDELNDYGQLITKDNVLEKMQERQRAYYELQKEWQATGTIALKGYDDPSNISVLPNWVYDMDLTYQGANADEGI